MNPKLEQFDSYKTHDLCSKPSNHGCWIRLVVESGFSPSNHPITLLWTSNFWHFNAEFFCFLLIFVYFYDETKGVTTSRSTTTTSTTAEVSATTVPIVISEAMLVLLFVQKAAYSSVAPVSQTDVDVCQPILTVLRLIRFPILRDFFKEWIGHFKKWFYLAGGRLL